MAGRPNGPPMGPPRVPSEEELSRLSREELIRRLRWTEGDRLRRIAEHSNIMKDVNRKMQALRNDARGGPVASDSTTKLQSDNQELRDLCCFLDDDRQKGRNLAQEWQRFGRYSANVLRTEVVGYQEKLKELEMRQERLLQENLELKELCFLLDQERQAERRNSLCSQCNTSLNLAPRAQGDGSYDNGMSSLPEMRQEIPYSSRGHQGDQSAYIRQLEDKVHVLEKEKRQMMQATHGVQQYPPVLENGEPQPGKPKVPHKPDSMAHALKVLEVHDKLDHGTPSGSDTEHMNDNHKAIVREMCNVVWRKLGDDPTRQGNQPAPAVSAPPRYPGGSFGPPGTPPKYSGSTGSLDRKGL
ncbi:coiled-coil domain-containing protein 85C-like [Acanthaster planci]|uniref:Coiled-coil domain-containing protein 85C-like n=1 Tax=Acanthaster planci TaxID=133434 RepID=A0A8B7YXD1_ACAPL|nr:coiled-coil domain-containing protein 85C-like [Acanthaster planci]